jgi:hypothetical protein
MIGDEAQQSVGAGVPGNPERQRTLRNRRKGPLLSLSPISGRGIWSRTCPEIRRRQPTSTLTPSLTGPAGNGEASCGIPGNTGMLVGGARDTFGGRLVSRRSIGILTMFAVHRDIDRYPDRFSPSEAVLFLRPPGDRFALASWLEYQPTPRNTAATGKDALATGRWTHKRSRTPVGAIEAFSCPPRPRQ